MNPVTNNSVTEAVQRYEYWRGGTEAVLTLSGPKGADNVGLPVRSGSWPPGRATDACVHIQTDTRSIRAHWSLGSDLIQDTISP